MKYKQSIPNITENYLDNLLLLRGIQNLSNYKDPSIEDEQSWKTLNNMAAAAQTVYDNINKKIALVIDCDCDGFTSSAIIYNYLHFINPEINITYYIHEGKAHGLEDMIDNLEGYDLIIIPDASSNDNEFFPILRGRGSSVVILDHHEVEYLDDNAIIVNNQVGEQTNKELTGAGVVYKFCEAFDELYNFDYAKYFIDLAAVGIIGDMSTILNVETRYIIKQGLSHITNPFLEELIEKQSYSIGSESLNPTAISFYIVPLINALIRVGKFSEKEIMFKAFVKGNEMTKSTKRGAKPDDYESYAQQAARLCVNARNRQNRLKDKAIDSIEMTIQKNFLNDNKILVVPVEDENIDTTLTGLIAMSLVSKYKKPVLLGRETDDGFLKGSLRSPDKTELVDLRTFLIDSRLFEYAQGHARAAGFGIALKNIDKFIEYANHELKDIDFNEGVYSVDFIRNCHDGDVCDLIYDLGLGKEYWSQGNPEPYVVVKNVYIDPTKDLQIMGSNKDSCKFTIDGVAYCKFKDPNFIAAVQSKKLAELTVLGRANLNTYMGSFTPQLFIDDYEIKEGYFEF